MTRYRSAPWEQRPRSCTMLSCEPAGSGQRRAPPAGEGVFCITLTLPAWSPASFHPRRDCQAGHSPACRFISSSMRERVRFTATGVSRCHAAYTAPSAVQQAWRMEGGLPAYAGASQGERGLLLEPWASAV